MVRRRAGLCGAGCRRHAGPGARLAFQRHCSACLDCDLPFQQARLLADLHVGQPARRNWGFLPMPGTTVRLQAGIGSERHAADLAAYRAQFLGSDAAGFTHYRLHL